MRGVRRAVRTTVFLALGGSALVLGGWYLYRTAPPPACSGGVSCAAGPSPLFVVGELLQIVGFVVLGIGVLLLAFFALRFLARGRAHRGSP